MSFTYFVVYTCTITFVILNLFVAVVLEGFDGSAVGEEEAIVRGGGLDGDHGRHFLMLCNFPHCHKVLARYFLEKLLRSVKTWCVTLVARRPLLSPCPTRVNLSFRAADGVSAHQFHANGIE